MSNSGTRGIGGWLTHYVIQCERVSAGFAGWFLQCSDERFQVVSHYLANLPQDWSTSFATVCFLREARHDKILHSIYGQPVPGLRQCLNRLGAAPKTQQMHKVLKSALSNAGAQTVHVLCSQQQLTRNFLEITSALPSNLRYESLVQMLSGPREARDLTQSVEFLDECGVDTVSLCAAISRCTNQEKMRKLLTQAALRATFPACPVPQGCGFSPILNGQELCRAAREMKNCLRSKVVRAITGKSHFARFDSDAERAIIELRPIASGKLLLAGIHGSANKPPSSVLITSARAYLQLYDVEGTDETNKEQPSEALDRILNWWFEYDED